MLVPIEWLNDYIDIDVSDEEFCDRAGRRREDHER